MKVKIADLNSFLLNSVVFLTFLGFYATILLLINLGLSGQTRIITIPLRMIIGLLCSVIFLIGIKNRSKSFLVFLVFAVIYLLRIITDFALNEFLYISYFEIFFYFISYVVIPFIAITKVDFNKINVNSLFKTFLSSAFIFSFLSFVFYFKYIGNVVRLSSSTVGEDVVNPLILSYCATLVIGVLVFYLINNKPSRLQKIIILSTISLAVVPFFLGASRGSLFALFVPFIIMAFSSISIKNFSKIFIISVFVIIALVFLDNYLGSGLLNRFLGTKDAIEAGEGSASRLGIWKQSLTQFINHPLFGDKLNTKYVNQYPHNIYIEVLQQVGIIGFLPVMVLSFFALKFSILIFKNAPQYSWITIFFLQSIMQNMFSGAIYTATWFWTGMALVFSLARYLRAKEYI